MARIYSEEEKRTHLDKYKVCGKTKTEYARENDIPELLSEISTIYRLPYFFCIKYKKLCQKLLPSVVKYVILFMY